VSKNAKLGDKGVVAYVMWHTYKFWDSLHISDMAADTNFIRCAAWVRGVLSKKCEIKGQRGRDL